MHDSVCLESNTQDRVSAGAAIQRSEEPQQEVVPSLSYLALPIRRIDLLFHMRRSKGQEDPRPAGSSCQGESRGYLFFFEVHCHSREESGQALKRMLSLCEGLRYYSDVCVVTELV